LNSMSSNVGVASVENFDSENMGVAAEILFLSVLELEIHPGKFYPLDNQRKYFILDIGRVNEFMILVRFNIMRSLFRDSSTQI
jgi:hypothetical protein